jgi:hypothetical protein
MGGAFMKGALALVRRPLRGDKCTRDENRMLRLPIIRCFHGARSVAAKSIGSVAILKARCMIVRSTLQGTGTSGT